MSPEPDSSPIRIDDLLVHAQWARALARSLVKDAATAEDLVQETWVAALEKAPSSDRPLRPWIAGVIRNLARFRARGEGRRARREEQVATERPAVPTPDELAQKLDSQRLLAEHVAQLEEPFRSTLLLRYYEDLSAAEIARHQGVPAGTVRWRLKRALDTLRDRLDTAHDGDRRAWCLALLPLARKGGDIPVATATATGTAGSSILGVFAMGTTLKITLGVATIVAAALLLDMTGVVRLGLFGDGRDYVTPERVSFRPVGDVPEAAPREDGLATSPERTAAAAAELARVSGRILDEAGAPVAGALISGSGTGTPASVKSGGDGRFTLAMELPAKSWDADLAIVADGYAWTSTEIRLVRGEERFIADLRLKPGGSISGQVVDPDGRPVPGAWVGVGEPDTSAADLDRNRRALTGAIHVSRTAPRTECDEHGRFALHGVEIGLQRLWAGHDGFVDEPSNPVEVRQRMESYGVTITVRPIPPEQVIRGLVVNPAGEPVARAKLDYRYKGSWGRSGSGTLSVGSDGRFERVVREDWVYRFTASDREGRWGGVSVGGVKGGDHDVVLRLTEKRYIEIAVEGPDGQPVGSFAVSLVDPDAAHLFSHHPKNARPDGVMRVAVPSRPFHLRVDADGFDEYDSGKLHPDSLGERHVARLVALPGVRGVIRANEKAIPGARVTLHKLVPQGMRYVHNGFLTTLEPQPTVRAETDAGGAFFLTLREAGKYRLRVEAPGYAPHESEVLELDPARGRDGIDVSMSSGGMIEGVLTLDGGASPAGRIVAISRADGFARTQRLGPDGKYRFENLTPGPWIVRETDEEIDPDNYSSSTGGGSSKPVFNTTVEEGRVTRFDLGERAAGLALRGTLAIEGRSTLGWHAALLPAGDEIYSDETDSTRTDRDGRFELVSPQAGKYRLRLRSPNGDLVLMDEVELRAATTWSRTLKLGTVEGALPQDESNYALLWKDPRGMFALALLRPGDDGRFKVDAYPCGEASIVKVARDRRADDPRTWPVVRTVVVE